METLGTGHRQLIEILKALVFETRVIAFDEPTAALSDEETRELFALIEKLKTRGISLIYVSHRLDEIFQIANRVTVFKDGRFVETRNISEVTKPQVISLMVGRDLNLFGGPRKTTAPGEAVLEVRNLCNGRSVQDISFQLRRGEILGFFGMVGSGRTETAMTIFGVTPPESGEVIVRGKPARIRSPIEAVRLRLGLVPENRIAQGVIPSASIRNNITLPFIERLSAAGLHPGRRGGGCRGRIHQAASGSRRPPAGPSVNTLSGGNQQKVSIAKWLASRSDVIIFDEPTHGVDVGAKAEIYVLLRTLADEGKAILFISSELTEILNVCDRIFVFRNGSIAHRFEENRGLSEESVIKYAIGTVEAHAS